MRISDWSSDVCSSDLRAADRCRRRGGGARNGDVHALAYLPHQPGWLSRVVEPRLSSSVFVTALMRRTESEGGYAALLAKGDPTAGAVLVVLAEGGRKLRLMERLLQPTGDYPWQEAVGEAAENDDEFERSGAHNSELQSMKIPSDSNFRRQKQ